MDLQTLFNNITRIADGIERIAEAAELIALTPRDETPAAAVEVSTVEVSAPSAAQVFNPFGIPGVSGTPVTAAAPAAAPAEPEKKPRGRAKKAAAEAGPVIPPAAAPTAPPPMISPAVGMQQFQQAQQQAAQQVAAQQVAAPLAHQGPATAGAPVGASSMPTATGVAGGAPGMMAGGPPPGAVFAAAQQPASIAAAPAPQAAPLTDLSAYKAAYTALDPVMQFGALNTLFMQASNNTHVRDALIGAAGQVGMQLPMSDPADRTRPNAAYQALPSDHRWHIYEQTFRALEAVTRAAAGG